MIMIELIILSFIIIVNIIGMVLCKGDSVKFMSHLGLLVLFSGLFYLFFHMYQLDNNSAIKKQQDQIFISNNLNIATQNQEIESYCSVLFKENLSCYNLNNLDPQSKVKCLKLNNLLIKNKLITDTTDDYLTNSLIYELQNNYIKKMANIN